MLCVDLMDIVERRAHTQCGRDLFLVENLYVPTIIGDLNKAS
jgi:hypothetical protein